VTASNEELKSENNKLYENILILQQKITDELGAQLSSSERKKETVPGPVFEKQKTLSLKDVSLVSDKEKKS
jgi:hypothetical protein